MGVLTLWYPYGDCFFLLSSAKWLSEWNCHHFLSKTVAEPKKSYYEDTFPAIKILFRSLFFRRSELFSLASPETIISLPQVASMSKLWVTAKKKHLVPGYHFKQSRCIYFANSPVWNGFQKQPLFGWTQAELPLEISYGDTLDPTNDVPKPYSCPL